MPLPKNVQFVYTKATRGRLYVPRDAKADFLEGLAFVQSTGALAANLRRRRTFLEYPQTEVAYVMTEVYGKVWHQTVVAKVESGDRTIRVDEAYALAHLYDLSLTGLVHGEGLDRLPRWRFRRVLFESGWGVEVETTRYRWDIWKDRRQQANEEHDGEHSEAP